MNVKVEKVKSYADSARLNISGNGFDKDLTLSNYQLEDGGLENRVSQFVEKFTDKNRDEVVVELGDGF